MRQTKVKALRKRFLTRQDQSKNAWRRFKRIYGRKGT